MFDLNKFERPEKCTSDLKEFEKPNGCGSNLNKVEGNTICEFQDECLNVGSTTSRSVLSLFWGQVNVIIDFDFFLTGFDKSRSTNQLLVVY